MKLIHFPQLDGSRAAAVRRITALRYPNACGEAVTTERTEYVCIAVPHPAQPANHYFVKVDD